MDGDLFEGVFASILQNPEKSVLLIDNASFHRKRAIYDIANDCGFRVMFLPAYSPDLNPIEKMWANTKRRMRLYMHKFVDFWVALSHSFK